MVSVRRGCWIRSCSTWRHQRDTYGPDATYDDFVTTFDEGTATAT
jgi:alpha-L-fucosidase